MGDLSLHPSFFSLDAHQKERLLEKRAKHSTILESVNSMLIKQIKERIFDLLSSENRPLGFLYLYDHIELNYVASQLDTLKSKSEEAYWYSRLALATLEGRLLHYGMGIAHYTSGISFDDSKAEKIFCRFMAKLNKDLDKQRKKNNQFNMIECCAIELVYRRIQKEDPSAKGILTVEHSDEKDFDFYASKVIENISGTKSNESELVMPDKKDLKEAFATIKSKEDVAKICTAAQEFSGISSQKIAERMEADRGSVYRIKTAQTNATIETLTKFADANNMELQMKFVPKTWD